MTYTICDAPQPHPIYVGISGFGRGLIIYKKIIFCSFFYGADRQSKMLTTNCQNMKKVCDIFYV